MNLLATLKKMNKRERYAIMLAAGVIGIFLIVTLIVEPFLSKTDQLKRNLQDKTATLEQMRQLQSEYA
jgi:type II secretory pathway component PulM